jgi:hypothetical protein
MCTACSKLGFGLQKNLWSPAAVGKGFDLSVTALAARTLPRLPDHRQQHRRAQR